MSEGGASPILFADGKEPNAMRTIGELAAALGVKTHILRYWEEQFEMLRPLKRSGGRRLYRPHDVALVAKIDRLVNRDGYTLKGARAAISDIGLANDLTADAGDTGAILANLKQIRSRLAAALET